MKKVINVVGAIIYSEGKILCAQRSENMSLPLMWNFQVAKLSLKNLKRSFNQRNTGRDEM